MSGSSQATGHNCLDITIAPTTSVTLCGWVKVNTYDKVAFDSVFEVAGGTGGSYRGIGFQQDPDGAGNADLFRFFWYNGSDSSYASVPTDLFTSTGSWLFVAAVQSGTALDFYWGTESGSLSHASLTPSFSASLFTYVRLASDHAGTPEDTNSSFRGWRLWVDEALTSTQLTVERDSDSFKAIHTTGLVSELPIVNGTSPGTASRGTNWTLTGTFADDSSNPSIPLPVVVPGTFFVGETSIGSFPAPSNSAVALAVEYTLGIKAKLVTLSIHITAAGDPGDQLGLGIYSDNGSDQPLNLLAQTALFHPTTGWNVVPIDGPVLSPAKYHIAAVTPASTNMQVTLALTAPASNYDVVATSGIFDDPWVQGGNVADTHGSIYATFLGVTDDAIAVTDDVSADKVGFRIVQVSGKEYTDNASGSNTLHMPGNFTAGSTGIVCVSPAAPGTTADANSVTINGVAATLVAQGGNGVGTFGYVVFGQIWVADNLPGGGDSYVITYTGSALYVTLGCIEVAGLSNPSFDVGTSGTEATTNTPTVTSPTLSQANELVVAVYSDSTGEVITNTLPSGWTNIYTELDGGNHNPGSAIYKSVSATSAVTATWTLTDTSGAQARSSAIASFKIAAGGGGGTTVSVDAGTDTLAVTDSGQWDLLFPADRIAITDSVSAALSGIFVTLSDTLATTDKILWERLFPADAMSLADQVTDELLRPAPPMDLVAGKYRFLD